jgi:hypothetical protein
MTDKRPKSEFFLKGCERSATTAFADKWREAYPQGGLIETLGKHNVWQPNLGLNRGVVIVKHPVAWVRSLWRYLIRTGEGKPKGQAYGGQVYHKAENLMQYMRGNQPMTYWGERHASWLYDSRIRDLRIVRNRDFMANPTKTFQDLSEFNGYRCVSYIEINPRHVYFGRQYQFDRTYYKNEAWRGEIPGDVLEEIWTGLLPYHDVLADLGYPTERKALVGLS